MNVWLYLSQMKINQIMFKVKINAPFSAESILCQTPGRKGIWNGCKFHINDDVMECDYWVVYEDLLQAEEVICPHNNILLITGEPPSVKKYESGFLNQFATIITCHSLIQHNNVVYTQQALPWHVGKRLKDKKNTCNGKDYDSLRAINRFNKNKLISIIVSEKNSTKGHRDRLIFVEQLKRYFGDQLDIFSRESKPVDDKWDAIAGYKYHIVIENSAVNDYWTEKLTDSFLGGAFPFYYGCKNIDKYFSKNALCLIDIYKISESVKLIEDAIFKSVYEHSIESIMESRNLVMDKYNLFPFIHDFVQEKIGSENRSQTKLYPQKKFIRQGLHFTKNITHIRNFLWKIKP